MAAKKIAFHYIIKIDPQMVDLIPGYLRHRKKDAVDLTELLKQRNAPGIRVICHNLVGSCASYGFDELGVISAEISAAAKQEKWDDIEYWIFEYCDYLTKVEFE